MLNNKRRKVKDRRRHTCAWRRREEKRVERWRREGEREKKER
jgi:hypothetical protein